MAKQQRENPKTKPWSYALLDPFLRILNPASKARCRIWCYKRIVSKFYIFKVYAYQNIMNLMRDKRVTKWSSSVNFNWRSWQKCKLQSVNLSDAVCTEFAVQIYTKQPYLSICWILEFISALFNNHTVIVQNLAFNHFKSSLCSQVNTGCRYASLVQNFSVGSEEILNVPFLSESLDRT